MKCAVFVGFLYEREIMTEKLYQVEDTFITVLTNYCFLTVKDVAASANNRFAVQLLDI